MVRDTIDRDYITLSGEIDLQLTDIERIDGVISCREITEIFGTSLCPGLCAVAVVDIL